MQTIIGVPQGSILGPVLFNIFLNDLLLINLRSIVCNFADDSKLYNCRETTESVVKNLQSDLKIVLKWFKNNQIMANPGKFQYMLLGKQKPLKIEIEGFQLESTKSVELLQISTDHNLTFDTQVSNICKTTRAKVKSLSRIRNALDEKQAKLLNNSFILSQFNCCTILWMFYSKTSYKKSEQIQKRGLQIAYNEPLMSLEELLIHNQGISVHHKHINTLLTEIYKIFSGENPYFMKSIFTKKDVI